MKSNILNNDSKMSISSISCISDLFNSNNKNLILKSFNSKLIKEVHESNFTLNNNKYLDNFHINNNIDNKRNKQLIWNKKKVYKTSKIHSINDNDNEKKSPIKFNIKEKYLIILIMKYSNNSKLNLYKYFMKFYLNSILYKNKNSLKKSNDTDNNDFVLLKKQKLLQIINRKKIEEKNNINIYFNKFYFKGLLKFMNNHWYFMDNRGRIKDINQNPFFIYEAKKNITNKNNSSKNNNQNRNIANKLKINRILKKILFQDKNMKKEKLKIYFYKFHLLGIFFYMKKELKKKIILKKLSLIEAKNNNFEKIDDNKEEMKNKKIKVLRRIINKKNQYCNNICKNLFNKWKLRTKIFSIIAIDKEKKKKRRIKKRNNKKLGANNPNNKNNNINVSNNSNIINNTNKKILSSNLNSIDLENKNKNKIINKPNYCVENIASVIFSNNIKINDYYKLNKFIEKINLIITKKYYFFNLIFSDYNNKKIKDNNEVKNNINEDIDFFIEDSSDNSEDQ